MKMNLKLVSGLVLVFFMWISGRDYAGTYPTPSPTYMSSQNDLHVQTKDGQSLEAPIKSFKGISLSVLMTLKKQGKMTDIHEPGSDPNGYMTFTLAPNVSTAFINWIKNRVGKGPSAQATGEFRWSNSSGKTTFLFKMTHLNVVRFYPADTKGMNGGVVILDADTQSFPPLFKSKKKT